MGAGVVKAQDINPHRPTSVRINVTAAPYSTTSTSGQSRTGFVVTPVQQDMSCEACSTNFTIFKRKKSCRDCGRYFCQDCLQKFLDIDIGNRRRSFRQCKNCTVLMSGHFSRQDLMKWKIKDLRILLTKKNISTDMCTEKPDLIDLLFIHFGNNSNSSTQESSDHNRRVDELIERMRDNISESSESPSPSESVPQTNENQGQDQGEEHSQSQSSNPPPQEENNQRNTETEEERQQRLLNRQREEMRAAQQRMANAAHFTMRQDVSAVGTPRKRAKLEDITDLDQVDSLTIQQLKEILVANFVNYKGCVEKYELVERVKRLWNERQINKKKVEGTANSSDNPGTTEDNEDEICKICMDAAVDCVLLECGHMVSCTDCGRRLAECPVCRQYVVRAVHVFKT